MDQDYADGLLTEAFNRFKYELFGQRDILLHTADINRNKNGFELLNNPQLRRDFYQKLNSLVKELDFTVVACAIRKNDHFRHYGAAAIDLYLLGVISWANQTRMTG